MDAARLAHAPQPLSQRESSSRSARSNQSSHASYTRGVMLVYGEVSDQHRTRGRVRGDDHGSVSTSYEDRGGRHGASPSGRPADVARRGVEHAWRPSHRRCAGRRAAADTRVILADTSAWVEYDQATGSAVDERITELIAGGDSLVVTEPVVMEVLAGARNDAREADLRHLLLRCGLRPFEAASDFEAAARIYRRC